MNQDARNKKETAKLRDETIRRMIATPPLKHADEKHPRKSAKPPPKKKAAKKRKTKGKDPG